MVAPFMPDAEKLAAVREALPALGAGIYLNTGSAGPMPVEVAAAMDELAGWELRTGRAHIDQFEAFIERMAEARAGIAAILVTDADSIAITHSATEGMNLATWAVDWRAGDRVVTTRHEHPGGLGPLIAVRDRFGVELAFAEIGDGDDDDRTIAAFEAAIVPGTRLVSLSHVLWTTGARLPLERIAAVAHDRGALVAVDGAQSIGAIPVAVHETGADFYAVAAQKWLLGPEGVGALWVAPAVMGRAAQTLAGWFSFETIDRDGHAVYHPSARRFEATNWHKPSITGFARSCGWLSMYVGLPWLHDRGTALAAAAADRLAAIPGVTILTPRQRMATLVSFRIAGWTAEAAVAELGSRVFAITRTIPALDAIRISVGFFNTEAEIERFAGAVETLAAHTPDTLPPKPRLTILGQGDGMSAERPAPRRRSWLEIRWRQFRNAPRPIVRAVLSSLVVAIALGLAYLAYDVAVSRGAVLPGGDLRAMFVALDVAVVLATGAIVTYLVVPQPTGSGGRKVRTPWSAALGFFAAVPICYLVLVVAVQIVKPLLV